MSQPDTHAHPARRRAGFLSALSKLYSKILRLIETDGTTEEALELQQKLQERYEKYSESHEVALASLPERESSLNASHLDVDRRHLEISEQLQAYIDDGTKTERSMHVKSLFSSRSSKASTYKTVSNKQSSRRSSYSRQSNSDRLSEARIQAELAKKNIEQQKALQEAQQQKLKAEREAARKKLEFERHATQKKAEMDHEAARRQMELDRLVAQRILLQEETERQHRELEEEMETQRQIAEYEKLRAEVRIREREEMRSELGSDFESSDEEVERDVTKPKVVTKNTLRFQSDDDQQQKMLKILESYSKPLEASKVTPQRAVTNWLDDSREFADKTPKVPPNTPVPPREKYIPPIETRRDDFSAQANPTLAKVHETSHPPQKIQDHDECSSMQGKTDAALFSRVLQENRLPKPKMMTFDGDPKRYKLFMASFRNNVEARLDGDDQLKLTLLLDQCTGEAFDLIEECVMLNPEQGYRTAIEKLERRFGKNHLVARSYIDGVKKGGVIKPNDVKALIKLADDMRKCQNVLTELRFASDLDSTGTIESIIDRLPEHLQNQWVKRSNKILNMGREPTFQDLTTFVEERADDYNSKYGQYIAEKRSAAASSKPRQQEQCNKSNERKRNVTTLATSATEGDSSTAGHDADSTSTSTSSQTLKKKCAHCEKIGHYIATCHLFKRLSLEEKQDVVKKKNLCFRCLRAGHGSSDCDKVCSKCSMKHHYHLHEEMDDSSKAPEDKTTAAGLVSSTTFKNRGRSKTGVIRVGVQAEEGEVLCWALLDTGSNTTFIKRSVADDLGLTGPDEGFSLTTLAGASHYDEMRVDVMLVSEDGVNSVDLRGALTMPSIQVRAQHDGTSHKKYKHLADLDFPEVDTEVDIIIGTDCPEMFWSLDERRGGRNEAIARKTILGWILLGPT